MAAAWRAAAAVLEHALRGAERLPHDAAAPRDTLALPLYPPTYTRQEPFQLPSDPAPGLEVLSGFNSYTLLIPALDFVREPYNIMWRLITSGPSLKTTSRIGRILAASRLAPVQPTLILTPRPLFSLECLDPGSCRKIPAICHGAGAKIGVFIPET